MELNKIYQGNSLEVIKTLPDESINTVVTSPPYYGLRDYGVDGQIGLEVDVEEYVQSLVNLFS
jgi:DNA modification methylase